MREICAICTDSVKIGGPGVTVEIDEIAIVKRKYHRGFCEFRFISLWCFQGNELAHKREWWGESKEKIRKMRSSLWLRKETVRRFSISSWIMCCRELTLLRIVGRDITESRTSLTWTTSILLSTTRYTLKDPMTGVHSNTIEGKWQKVKVLHKARFGTHRSTLLSHIAENVFLNRFARPDRMHAIFAFMADQFAV